MATRSLTELGVQLIVSFDARPSWSCHSRRPRRRHDLGTRTAFAPVPSLLGHLRPGQPRHRALAYLLSRALAQAQFQAHSVSGSVSRFQAQARVLSRTLGRAPRVPRSASAEAVRIAAPVRRPAPRHSHQSRSRESGQAARHPPHEAA